MPQLDWNATINAIRESVPQTQFQNWFKPVTLIRQDETTITLGVPSRFHEEWLKSNYSRHITQAIRTQSGLDLQLEFEVLVQNENEEAALSLNPVSPLPGTRPALRVIAGQNQESFLSQGGGVAQPPVTPEAAPVLPEAPNTPQFAHDFFEFPFNHVAYQCAGLVVQGSLPVNPLVIQAGVGMGKTHLLSDIASRLYRKNNRLKIRYTNSESFTAEMVQSFRSNDNMTFKKKYRENTDILLFDDVHQIAGRMKTQEEVVHIFNEITARGGRLIFTSLVPIHRLEEFIDPLRSRLSAGVVAEIRPASYEDRIQVLGKSCELNKLIVPPELLNQLADQGQKDIRELLGSLVRLHLQAQIENKELDSKFLAREGWVREAKKEAINLDEIVTLVEHNYGILRSELTSKSRKSVTTWARQVAMYLARHYTLLPLEEIGKAFGRDHATVIHAFQKVTETMESQPHRKYEVEFLKQKLQGGRAPEEMPNF